MPNAPAVQPLPRITLLHLGFRPFFLLGALSATFALLVWLGMLHGLAPLSPRLPGPAWHAHEMLFGYGLAIIAGFLLTASRNWTGKPTANGLELAALVGLWVVARLLPWLPVPPWLAALLAAALPLALMASLWRVLWGDRNRVNRVFLGILAGMGLAAGWTELAAAGAVPAGMLDAYGLMLDLILLTLMLVSGRVLPLFTRVGVPGATPRSWPLLERLTFIAVGAWIVAGLLTPWPWLRGIAALLLAAVLAVRVTAWHDRRVWSVPLLAVLYAGATWLVLGLVLQALARFGLLPPTPALHALTAGAMGVFTLGMIVRVTLGHTGRPMRAPRALVAAFVVVNVAALIRVLFPMLWPGGWALWMGLSGLLWSGAFATFLIVIGPMLLAPRADGRPI